MHALVENVEVILLARSGILFGMNPFTRVLSFGKESHLPVLYPTFIN